MGVVKGSFLYPSLLLSYMYLPFKIAVVSNLHGSYLTMFYTLCTDNNPGRFSLKQACFDIHCFSEVHIERENLVL